MAKARWWLVDYLVYLVVRVVVVFVQLLSWPRALELARVLGWLGYHLNRRHRLVARDNLACAFPELDSDALDRLVRATYRHWATVLVEMIRLPRVLRPSNSREHFFYGDDEEYHRAVHWANSSRARLLLTGHFGNFEALSYAIGVYGTTGAVVARKLDNPYLDRFLRVFRQKTGQEMLDKNEDYDRILHTLTAGHGIGIVGDQDAGPRGVFVDFLGRPASTFKSVALLSLEFQAPIVVMGAARVGEPMRYRIYLEDVILPEDYATDRDAVQAITVRYTQALERLVRRHPEQYFWLHRRWKSQPRARRRQAA